MKKFLMPLIFLWALLLFACTETKQQESNVSFPEKNYVANSTTSSTDEINKGLNVPYEVGDIVPHDEVCMVNNIYMGRKQISVIFKERTYYGCCEMCQKRIPNEEKVRTTIDPYSKKQVDKADAIIAIANNEGRVIYFENKENYQSFFAKQNRKYNNNDK